MTTTPTQTIVDALLGMSTQLSGVAAQVRQLGTPTECPVNASAPTPPTGRVGAGRLGAVSVGGRLAYEGCFAAAEPGRSGTTLLGTVGDSAVVHCARLARERGGTAPGPLTFAVRNGTECWLLDGMTVARQAGSAGPARCGVRPDALGQVAGGVDAMSVYTLDPEWLEMRCVRILRRIADRRMQPNPEDAHLHVVGVVLMYGRMHTRGAGHPAVRFFLVLKCMSPTPTHGDGPSPNVKTVTTQPGPPQPLPDATAGESPADARPTDTVARHAAATGRATAALGPGCINVGPSVGASITFDYGTPVRIVGVQLRNRSVSGHPAIEERLRGAWIQLLREPGGSVLWERPVEFGAPA